MPTKDINGRYHCECGKFLGKAKSHKRCPAKMVAKDQDRALERALPIKAMPRVETVAQDWIAQSKVKFDKAKATKTVATLQPQAPQPPRQQLLTDFAKAMRIPNSPEDASVLTRERAEVLSRVLDPRDGSPILSKYKVSWSPVPAFSA